MGPISNSNAITHRRRRSAIQRKEQNAALAALENKMTDRTIIRLAEIAREFDQAGKPHHADIIEDAMIRLSQSAIGNWWNGVKHVGEGVWDDAKAAGNALAIPFEGVAAGAKAAWDGGGLAYAPHAAGEAEAAAWDRAKGYTQQELQQYQQAVPKIIGPGGTGLPGAVVEDAVSGIGNTVNNAAQGYLNNVLDQREQAKQQANIASWLQQVVQRHKQDGHGWDVINSAIQYGGLSAENQAKLRQEFQAKAAQYSSNQASPH